MAKIIFLDIDGVLVNQRSWGRHSGRQPPPDPLCIAALNRIIAATGADIVVTSTWRLGKALAEMRDLLHEWGIMGNVLGTTPFCDGAARGIEIRLWMQHKEIERFVIIDDDQDVDDLDEFLVKTSFDVGLTEGNADQAIQVLRG